MTHNVPLASGIHGGNYGTQCLEKKGAAKKNERRKLRVSTKEKEEEREQVAPDSDGTMVVGRFVGNLSSPLLIFAPDGALVRDIIMESNGNAYHYLMDRHRGMGSINGCSRRWRRYCERDWNKSAVALSLRCSLIPRKSTCASKDHY